MVAHTANTNVGASSCVYQLTEVSMYAFCILLAYSWTYILYMKNQVHV